MKSINLPINELKPALTGLSKVVRKNATLPILTSIAVTRDEDGWVTITGTDLDSFATEAAPATKTGPRTIDELLRNVSASRLSTFHSCRLKFYFRYVLGLVSPKSAALHVGSCVHLVLKHWNLCRWRNQRPTLKELHDVYLKSWADENEQQSAEWADDSEEEQKTTGWKLLDTYFRESPIKLDEKPEAVEVSVEADLKHRGLPNLVGIIDLIRTGGRIVDFKTSGKSPDPGLVGHLNEIQLSCCSVMYQESTGSKESGYELHHLVKTKMVKVVVTPLPAADQKQESRLFRSMESYAKGVAGKDWVPNRSILCASCEFFAECRKWK